MAGEGGSVAGPMGLTTAIESVAGVTPGLAVSLRRLGITNVGRLIDHLPFRHERELAEQPIGALEAEALVTATGEVSATRLTGFGKRQRFEAVLVDGSGRLDLVWFNMPYLRRKLHPGMRLRVQGVTKRRGPGLQVANPLWEILREEGAGGEDGSGAAGEGGLKRVEDRLKPVYPAGEGASSRQIEEVAARVLEGALGLVEDHLPAWVRREREMPELREAYRMMHRPTSEAEVGEGRRRLAYDELLFMQLGVQLRRRELREWCEGPELRVDEAVMARVRERFPFELTGAQERVIGEVAADVSRGVPMNRLVQGDVGSGKTVVALAAMLMAVASGHQAALMAPTELLAEQHMESIGRMLEGSRVRVGLLTGSVAGGEREGLLERVASGGVDVVIGTHALLTERVRFGSLGLVVIDEQHRFGVEQRGKLGVRGTGVEEAEGGARRRVPHVMVMTATPIPRTLALTVFGDLDVSTIDQMPAGRQRIETVWVPGAARAKVYERLAARVGGEGAEQGYVVASAIESVAGSDGQSAVRGVREIAAELEAGALRGRRVAVLHGQMSRSTRETVMGRFRLGLIDVLVATTVIEVGVDVPSATVMVIEQADRFGLAQLHQLRGRVGRGSKASACVLVADPATEDARLRLEAMVETGDGFALAERDLAIRGPGELFGASQSGAMGLRVADVVRDAELLLMARRDASAWIERSPRLAGAEEALLRRRLVKRLGREAHLIEVA